VLNLLKVLVRSVRPLEQQRFQKLMQAHHYLGALPKISETLWYVATFADQWVAQLSFSATALKCSVRDRWIGWDFRHQYDRLKLVTNNSRFLILPDLHFQIWPLVFYRCAIRDCRRIVRRASLIKLRNPVSPVGL